MDNPDILSSLTEVDERTRTQLTELFNWNPSVFELGVPHASKSTQARDPAFYDKHLAKHLRLLKLCVSPSIPSRLLEYVDKALLVIKEKGISFYAPGVESLSNALLDVETTVAIQDAKNKMDLVNSYKVTTAAFTTKVASMIALHPGATSLWTGILSWDTNRLESSRAVADGYLAVKAKFKGVSATDALNNPTHPQLPRYVRNMLDALVKLKKAIETENEDEEVDSSDEGVPLIIPQKNTRSGKRKRDEKDSDDDDADERRRKDYELRDEYKESEEGRAKHWVQQIWCEAVRADVTVIVLHPGNYEIIGFRHRKSQTLYISDIIEPPVQAEYGKIEVGLYIAAFQDASKRAKMMDEEGKNESTEDDDDEGDYTDRPPTRKRGGRGGRGSRGGRGTSGARGARGHSNGNKGGLRPPPGDAEKETQGRRVKGGEIDKALQLTGSRNIAAMFLRYGIYDSVSPACFYRTRPSLYTGAVAQSPPPSRGKLSYNADEYVTFALISEYENCATGVVHAAVLEVRTHEGHCLTRDAIVKLAFSTDQQERLLNEYRIYSLMAAKNVEEIPVVLGLYKDIEGEPSALVMTHEGTSLDDRGGSVTPAERVAFIQALKAIHAAGILHNDIRRRNLLVNETGEVAIIDFDQGTRNNSPTKQAQELAVLENVLAGL